MERDQVLLVEDHPDTREVIRIVLEDLMGIRVVLAKDGEEALALLRERMPSLVVLDLALPGIGGTEVARRLKTNPETRDIPVVAVTALEKGCELAMLAGCDDCIEKPFEVCALSERLERYLTRELSEC